MLESLCLMLTLILAFVLFMLGVVIIFPALNAVNGLLCRLLL